MQWKLITDPLFILGANYLLHRIDATFNDKCNACLHEKETIEHIFWECKKNSGILDYIWTKNLTLCIFQLITIKSPFLIGLYCKGKVNIAQNTILIWLEYYIYKTKMQKEQLNLNSAKEIQQH